MFKLQAVDQPISNSEVDKMIDDLYEKMPKEERYAQLYSIYMHDLFGEDGHLDPALCREKIPYGVGHFAQYAGNADPNTSLEKVRDMVAELQDWLMHNTPNGIPGLFHEEVLSGFCAAGATTYPQQIGQACSFNIDLAEEKTRQTQALMRNVGGLLSLSPMVDVSRNPSFNRNEESYGEDGYLSAAFGVAFVKGLHNGEGLENGVAACGKHFLGYGSGHQCEDKELMEEIMLPHEAMARVAGMKVVMTGYHQFRDRHCIVNPLIANGLLRQYLNWDGVMVSDYGSANQFPLPAEIDDPVHRAVETLNAGNDVEFPSPDNHSHIQEAIDKGLLDEKVVEESVKRVLRLKAKMGLFKKEPRLYGEGKIALDTPEERATAYNIASQSIVLLKNNGILPLNKPYKIALSGPNANHYWSMLGDYTYQSMSYFWRHNLPDPSNPKIVCLKEALENKMPQGSSLTYHRGCDWTEEIETVIERAGDSRAYTMLLDYIHKVDAGEEADAVAALNAARESDVIIAAVGENVMLCGENRDRLSLGLPGRQKEYVESLIATGKPVVLIVFGGRAQVLGDLVDKCAAVIQAWYPGEEGGNALADILYGKISPSGKLSVSYPKVELHENICYNTSVAQDSRIQYPFGYGLSYTTFEYSDLSVESSIATDAEALHISFDVKNTGEMKADEIVQIYLSPTNSGQPMKPIQLHGFGRVSLAPGEKKTLKFIMSPQQFAHYEGEIITGKWVIDPGTYTIKVAASSQDIRLSQDVTLTGSRLELPLRTVYFTEQV